LIFHIVKRSEWEAAKKRQTYAPLSLTTEGFIHCSSLEQLRGSGERFFRGQTDLVVLSIDPSRLTAQLKIEAGFPHIYGELNLDAIEQVADFIC
jgi:uncharacterized protein (DUF952 family)